MQTCGATRVVVHHGSSRLTTPLFDMLRFACLFVSLSATRAQDTKPMLTPCQACCAPGGDCSKAYKGTAGKCCGIVQGQAFCCPGVTFRGPSSGDAKCYNCGTTYRCFTGFSSQNVCGNSNGGGGGSWSRSQMRERHSGQAGQGSMFFMLLLGFVAVVLVLNCSRSREMHYEGKPVAYGVPASGQPMMAGGYGQPVMGGPVMGGGYGGGYGGGSVAAGAGMGFLGGMVRSSTLTLTLTLTLP